MSSAQRKYSAYDRELLAIYTAVKRFRHALEGRHFIIYTDHKPLTYAFKQNLDKCSPRQFRLLDYIGQFTTDIRYIKGPDNNVADALSRIEAIGMSVDHRTHAAAQESDDELHDIVNTGTRALRLKRVRFPDHNVELYCDVSGNIVRPYVPKSLRRDIFNSLHVLSNLGIRATQKLVTTRFVWPSMNQDYRTWTRQCIPCQRCKVTRHVSSPVGTFGTLADRFEHIHVDIIAMQLSRPAYFKSDGPMMEIEMWRPWRQCISLKCLMSHLYPNGPSTECSRSVTTVTYAYRVVGILRGDKQRKSRSPESQIVRVSVLNSHA